ncbi:hypothetical protein BpHYR1_002892 [Brachionus plicatilis]|uniref:Uncharacterized protein n=1 Tax=Brachionus plicatilis TaxID=10195 RepID=A0A3M7QAM2_BRAPC|nr:hypothetical protein BpHYR1_002892 [Brachionus plicatilis]
MTPNIHQACVLHI